MYLVFIKFIWSFYLIISPLQAHCSSPESNRYLPRWHTAGISRHPLSRQSWSLCCPPSSFSPIYYASFIHPSYFPFLRRFNPSPLLPFLFSPISMESLAPSEPSISCDQKLSSSPRPPIKSGPSVTAPSPSKAAPFDQMCTPEKPVQLPRRARNRSVVFSVKEVKRVALGLQRSADRSDLTRSDDDLLPVEEQMGAGSGSGSVHKPSRAKTPVKLPEK